MAQELEGDSRFDQLLEALPDAHLIVGRDGRIVTVNSQAERMFGYARLELLGEAVEKLVPAGLQEGHRSHRERYVEDPQLRPMGENRDLAAARKDGSRFPVEISLSPLGAGETLLVSAVIRDVTERHRTEELLRLAHGELEVRVHELEAFTHSVSHDLRAPVRQISGFASMLLDEQQQQLDETGRHRVERIRGCAQRMGRLLEDLLSLSRLGRQEVRLQQTDLDALVREVIAELELDPPGREVGWRLAPLGTAECDPTLIRQVFVNLLSNALKFTRPASPARIEIGRETTAGVQTFFVRDNGVGFDMRYAERLFSLFERLHTEETLGGTGVGLAIVEHIVWKHGGRVWADSRPGEGAVFRFTMGERPPSRLGGLGSGPSARRDPA